MSWNECVQGGGDRLLYEAMICRHCEAGAASAFRVPLARVRSAQRDGAAAAWARAAAIYLAAVGFGLSATTAGRAFGRHRSTIDHACRRIEARRGAEPDFDTAIACLADALARRTAGLVREAELAREDARREADAPAMPAFGAPVFADPACAPGHACAGGAR